MNENIKKYLEKFLSIIIILAIVYVINLLLDKTISKVITKKKNKNLNTILLFFKRIKKVVIYSIGIIICLSKFEIFSTLSVTILSGIGILTTVLGLAAKDTLTDFFGSLGLVFGGPFEVGDYIRFIDKDITGTVEEITMRHTIIKTITNKRIIVPNSVMNTMAIENYNRKENEICVLGDYTISYESDIDKAIEILKRETKKLYQMDDKYKDIEYPKVRVISWDPSSITLRTWIWGSNSAEATENYWQLNYIIKKEFEKNGIEIPYNHLNVILNADNSKK